MGACDDRDKDKPGKDIIGENDVGDSPRRHRFCDDRRIHEVTRILRSTDGTVISPIMIKPTDQSAEFSEAKARSFGEEATGRTRWTRGVQFAHLRALRSSATALHSVVVYHWQITRAERCASDTSRRGCGADPVGRIS